MGLGTKQKLTPKQIYNALVKAGNVYATGKSIYNQVRKNRKKNPKTGDRVRVNTDTSMPDRILTTLDNLTKRKRTSGGRGSSTSISSGFMKKGAKKVRSGKMYKQASKGVVFNLEKGDVTVASKCEYIGHASMPYLICTKVIAAAIVKTLCELKRTYYTDDSELFHGQATRVLVDYKANQQDSTVTAQQDFAAGSTVADVVTFMYNTLNVIFIAGSQQMLQSIVILESPAVGSFGQLVRMPMEQSKIHLWSKSTLKIQNRSKIAEDDEADDVDNVPLYGKSYDGIGNGTSHIKNGETEFMFADLNGIIEFDGGVKPYLNEPPQGYEFVNVKTVGKAHLDPGHIKTSVLNSSKTGRLNDILHAVLPAQGGGFASTTKPQIKVGQFRLFALEKMIETLNSAPTPINVAYEHNLRIGAYMTVSYPKVQCTVNTWP